MNKPAIELEVLLVATNMIDPRKAHLAGRAAPPPAPRSATDKDDDDDDEDRRPVLSNRSAATRDGRSTTGTTNHRSSKIRTGTVGRDDSDSDYDL